MWNVILVPQKQLQCVCSRFQGDFRLRLAGTKVQMIEVVGNGLIERWQLGVDQQMVMSRIGRSEPAGATPISRKPNRTVTFGGTVWPSLRSIK